MPYLINTFWYTAQAGYVIVTFRDTHLDHLQASEIRHFVYKSRKTSCITSPKVPVVYRDKEDRDR